MQKEHTRMSDWIQRARKATADAEAARLAKYKADVAQTFERVEDDARVKIYELLDTIPDSITVSLLDTRQPLTATARIEVDGHTFAYIGVSLYLLQTCQACGKEYSPHIKLQTIHDVGNALQALHDECLQCDVFEYRNNKISKYLGEENHA